MSQQPLRLSSGPRQRVQRLRPLASSSGDGDGSSGGGAPKEPGGQPPVEVEPPAIDFDGEAGKGLQLPREVIQQLRDSVFGFDTFFVTGVENYEQNGVLFKGNVRGDPSAAYAKLEARLQALLGDEYVLYLLENREGKPVAVVLPASAVVPPEPLLSPAALAALFGIATVATTLAVNGVPGLLSLDPVGQPVTMEAVMAALPGSLAFLALLGVHEAGHRVAASQEGVKLSPPVFVPSGLGLLGSFGAITQPEGVVPNRTALLKIATAGPLAGAAASLAMLLLGFGLTSAGLGGVEVEPSAFQDSLLVGLIGRALLGSQLDGVAPLDLSPLLLAGWAGLVVNALNAIPAGDLDGARAAAGMWGRRAGTALSTLSLLLLGLAGVIDTLCLFWVLIVIFLQRGPVAPQAEELGEPSGRELLAAGVATLLLPLLVLPPLPGQADGGGGGVPGL